MASSTNASAYTGEEEELKAKFETGTFPVPDDAEGRTESAHSENMVVVPEFDKFGYATGNYVVASQSESVYSVDRQGGDCMDAEMNEPHDGCKHYRRVQILMDELGSIFPFEDEPVEGFMEEHLAAVVEDLAGDRTRLQKAKQLAQNEPDMAPDKPEEYQDQLDIVELFIETLADAYDEYRDEITDGEAPALDIER